MVEQFNFEKLLCDDVDLLISVKGFKMKDIIHIWGSLLSRLGSVNIFMPM